MTYAELLAWFSNNLNYEKYKDYIVCLVNDNDEAYMMHEIEIDDENGEKLLIIT